MIDWILKLTKGCQQKRTELRNAVGLAWQAAPRWSAASLVISFVQGFLPAAIVYLTARAIDQIVNVASESHQFNDFTATLPLLVLLGLVMFVEQELQNIQSYVFLVIGEYNRAHLLDLVYKKAVSLDLAYFDSLEYQDQLQRASADSVESPLRMLQAVNTLLRSLLAVVTMGGLLIYYANWLPLVLFAGILPMLITNFRFNRKMYTWSRKNAINRRRLNYYSWLMTVNQAAAEIRLFNLGGHLVSESKKLRQRLRDERLALTKRHIIFEQTISDLIGMGILAGLLLWMINRALQGLFSWGSLAAFYQVVNQGRRVMRALAGGLSDVMSENLSLGEVLKFLQLEPLVTSSGRPDGISQSYGLKHGINFHHVNFHYPGNSPNVINNFNLLIPAGKVVAIVGENGAGKSTLIKLLCRLYEPSAGVITWDGVDLRDVPIADLRRRMTVLFQQYLSFHDTASMNIAMGDLDQKDDLERIKCAAKQAQADKIIESLPEDYETLLGKWFGYTDLSGGEWQRIALARAFLRQADLIILDEPTSAMDTWSEAAWMARFRDLVSGHTALVITHRFSMARQADIIHVMSDGCIVESGSHQELMALNGLFAQSWKLQMEEMPRST